MTTWMQQSRYYRETRQDDRCPRTIFLEDLKTTIQPWIDAGDQVIVGIDANEDVRQGATHSMFRSIGMKDAILTKYRTDPPETYQRNFQRKPIDAIFVTTGIEITQGGYTNYGDIMMSDHRTLWIDVPFESCLGFNPPDLHKKQINRVNPKDPRNRKNFVEATKRWYRLHDNYVPKQEERLRRMVQAGVPTPVIQAEHHDLLIADKRAKEYAAQNARRVFMGRDPWSPRYQAAREKWQTWILIKRRFYRPVSDPYLKRCIRRCDLEQDVLTWRLSEVETALQEAHDEYKQARKVADTWRKDFLENLAKARAEDKGTSQDTELKQLKAIKKAKTTGRRVRNALGKGGKGLATELHRPIPESDEIEICDTQDTVVDASIEENTKRFTRAIEISPFCQEPLLSQIGWLGEGPAVEEILAGTYEPPPETDEYTKLFLEHLKMPPEMENLPEITGEISVEEHQRGWKRQNTHTAADPRSLTFAQYQATASDDDLSRIDATIRSVPLLAGFAPPDWLNFADCSIPKKISNLLVEKMRTICLMPAAYNINNKYLAQLVMERMEALYLLVAEQGGGRKKHQVSHQVLNRVLVSDLLRIYRLAGFLCMNDAIQCYDRIIHAIISICLQRAKVAWNFIVCLLLVLQLA